MKGKNLIGILCLILLCISLRVYAVVDENTNTSEKTEVISHEGGNQEQQIDNNVLDNQNQHNTDLNEPSVTGGDQHGTTNDDNPNTQNLDDESAKDESKDEGTKKGLEDEIHKNESGKNIDSTSDSADKKEEKKDSKKEEKEKKKDETPNDDKGKSEEKDESADSEESTEEEVKANDIRKKHTSYDDGDDINPQYIDEDTYYSIVEDYTDYYEQRDRNSSNTRIIIPTIILVIIIVGCVIAIIWVIRKKKNNKNRVASSAINPKEEENDVVVDVKPIESVTYSSVQVEPAWVVVGASVKGNGHIQTGMPCQDNHVFESISNGWGIAIVSDGAGSAARSDMGSKILVSRGLAHFKNLIEKEGWIEKKILPSDMEWWQKAYSVLKDVRNDIIFFAQKNNIDLKDLSATCIFVIYSPYGLLTAHVGDGRMGYKTMSNEWKSMMTPHKGNEANQTVFLVSDFWDIPNYTLSGVLVPETMVIRESVKAFVLMSDGCENTAWLCTTLNSESGIYYDRNIPFDRFFNPLEETLISFVHENVHQNERQEKWYRFLEKGTDGFVKEQDDKTMIFAVNLSLIE
jgi:hypothetical protein